MCKQFVCVFVHNRDPVPAMPMKSVSVTPDLTLTGDCHYFEQDIPNAEHIEREHGVSQFHTVRAFQRMFAYVLLAKDIQRKIWQSMPRASEAVESGSDCVPGLSGMGIARAF